MKKILSTTLIATILISIIATTGCTSVSEGFSRNNASPIVTADGYNRAVTFNIRDQFTEINDNPSLSNRRYFLFHNQLHYVKVPDFEERLIHSTDSQWAWNSSHSFTVYRSENYNVYLGSFCVPIIGRNNGFHLSVVFLHEYHIYYQIHETDRIGRFFQWDRTQYIWDYLRLGYMGVLYYRQTFFRFNISTGENEEVKLYHFFNRLKVYIDDIKLNPNFSVR